MPWDPVHDLLTMQERLESLFGRATPGWVPPADLIERPDRYVLTIELPGMKRDDVRIDGEAHAITISGVRPGYQGCPDRYEQLERGQGHFSRTFRFAGPIDPATITAELADGVLTVTAPKAQPAITEIRIK